MAGIELDRSAAPPVAPPDRAALDEVLAHARRLALARFPGSQEAIEAFFEIAANLSLAAWPDRPPPDIDEEEAPPGEAELQELLSHLEQLEELLEALKK